MTISVFLRGGGDLASGVAIRLHRAGMKVIILELAQPLVVRRKVAFAEAVYEGSTKVEGVTARLVAEITHLVTGDNLKELISAVQERGEIPVIIDPDVLIQQILSPEVLVDGRMTKQPGAAPIDVINQAYFPAPLLIGLGPGFFAGQNCHAAIETRRGHYLGRVFWEGETEPDTGIPEQVGAYREERVLRAPRTGILIAMAEIGDYLDPGQPIVEIDGEIVRAPFRGVLRGLVHPGLFVRQGLKIGDVDPRTDPRLCVLVSEKSLAVGGGVLEAILSLPYLRKQLSG